MPSGAPSSLGLLAAFPPSARVFAPVPRVLLPRAALAPAPLAAGLRARGWALAAVPASRPVRAAPPPAPPRALLPPGGFAAV
ncbi:bifunctional uroporphyrinogen-III C-methyltransferase/uroporphyrinogen-III synthase, partial [Mycobacterium tuberculosis]